MDTTLILAAAVSIIIILSPFFFHYLSQKKNEIRFLNELTRLAECENAIITKKDFWRKRYAIGIDETSKKVFYININKDKEERTIIDLSEVDKCKIDTVSRNAKNNTGNVTIIESLNLIFEFNKPDKPGKILHFYDCSEFLSIDNERILIEKWFAIIRSNLKRSS